MKIILEIPKEFEKDYITDKFEETFKRAFADILLLKDKKPSIRMCGNYEIETLKMLFESFQDSQIVNAIQQQSTVYIPRHDSPICDRDIQIDNFIKDNHKE